MPPDWKNKLYFGDNLDILREHIAGESVDLVYLDPPFNSNATYNVLFAEKTGEKSAAQITAFEDTWHWGEESEATYHDTIRTAPKKLADLLQAMRQFLGQNDMMAYLVMMAPRLAELHRVLKPTGSLYLHCDPTASHYIKLLLDAVFGPVNFRNEIVWERTTGRKAGRQFGRVHDVILFYSRSTQWVWNPPMVAQTESTVRGHDLVRDADGALYRLSDLTGAGQGPPRVFGDRTIDPPPGRHWMFDQDGINELFRAGRIVFSKNGRPRLRTPLSELPGVAVRDIWTDVEPLNSAAAERLGYPTQKPEALLERIIQSSSNEGDVVLDPFCGCGTAIVVAERLHRRWIGIDVTHLAITLIRHRLHNAFGDELSPYEVIGDPKDVPSAEALAREDRYKFQWWALGLVDARPAQDQRKKGADTGIDGYIYFLDDNTGKAKQIVVQVKSGHVSVRDIRDLKGVLEREKASIGVFITLEEPTRQMREEAVSAGFYEPEHYPGRRIPRLQILSVRELLDGREVQYPRGAPVATFRRAERRAKRREEQGQLL